MIVKNVGGVQTFELDEAELEAHVKAAVDRKLDFWFKTYADRNLHKGFESLLTDVGRRMLHDGRADALIRKLLTEYMDSKTGFLVQYLRKQLLAQVAAREDAVIQSALHKLRENP